MFFFCINKMPKRKRTFKKRRFKKRKFSRKKAVIRRLPLTGFPRSKLVRMRYVESVVIDPGSVVPILYEFNCNNIFDPNRTGTGHQPRSHDQWSEVYGRYNVVSSKCYVRCHPSSGTVHVPGVWGLSVNRIPGEFTGLDRDQIIESKVTNPKHVRTMGGDVSFGGLPNTATRYFVAKKHFGLGKTGIAEYERNSAAFGAAPVTTPVFTLWASHVASNNPRFQEFTFIIEYVVLLTEPKNFDES